MEVFFIRNQYGCIIFDSIKRNEFICLELFIIELLSKIKNAIAIIRIKKYYANHIFIWKLLFSVILKQNS